MPTPREQRVYIRLSERRRAEYAELANRLDVPLATAVELMAHAGYEALLAKSAGANTTRGG